MADKFARVPKLLMLEYEGMQAEVLFTESLDNLDYMLVDEYRGKKVLNSEDIYDGTELKYKQGWYVVGSKEETPDIIEWLPVEDGLSGSLEIVETLPVDEKYIKRTVLYTGPSYVVGDVKFYHNHIYLGIEPEEEADVIAWEDVSAENLEEQLNVVDEQVFPNQTLVYNGENYEHRFTLNGQDIEQWTTGAWHYEKIQTGRVVTLRFGTGVTGCAAVSAWGIIMPYAEFDKHMPKPSMFANGCDNVTTGPWLINGSLMVGGTSTACRINKDSSDRFTLNNGPTAIGANALNIYGFITYVAEQAENTYAPVINKHIEWESVDNDAIKCKYTQNGPSCRIELFTNDNIEITQFARVLTLQELTDHGIVYPSHWDATSNNTPIGYINQNTAIGSLYINKEGTGEVVISTSIQIQDRLFHGVIEWIAEYDTSDVVNAVEDITDKVVSWGGAIEDKLAIRNSKLVTIKGSASSDIAGSIVDLGMKCKEGFVGYCGSDKIIVTSDGVVKAADGIASAGIFDLAVTLL